MLSKKLAIIGGSGLYELDGASESKWETIETHGGVLLIKY